MATRGPASVLDRRETDNSINIVRDRLTRHRSPARDYKRYSYTSDCSADGSIDLSISQPYRTSFSAVVSATRNRSRSTSPCTSSLKGSNRSRSKSPGGRRAHKHVTYDDRVVIRDSGTSDSIITNLSDKESSCGDSAFASDMSSSSPRDYSSELRELSQQIVREYSTSEEAEQPNNKTSSHNKNHVNGSKPNGSIAADSRPQTSSQPLKQVVRKNNKLIVSEDYDNDRSVSYRVAIQNNYSEDIKQEAAKIMESAKHPEEAPSSKKREERSSRRRSDDPDDTRRRPNDGAMSSDVVPSSSQRQSPKEHSDNADGERRSSLPQDPAVAKSRLTPSKRSISSSIGNFFRRLSPHMGRRNKKGHLAKTSSQSLSHGDDLDSSFDKTASTSNLSRGKLRRSLMKVFGKSKKSKSAKSLNKSDLSVDDLNQSNNSAEEPSRSDQKSPLYMKSIEQTSKTDKDVYHKFKERQSRESNTTGKRQPMRAGVVSPDRVTDRKDSNGDLDQVDKLEPPNSLDVRLAPKSVKSLQASKMSSISVDDSIGDCSINPNLSGKCAQRFA